MNFSRRYAYEKPVVDRDGKNEKLQLLHRYTTDRYQLIAVDGGGGADSLAPEYALVELIPDPFKARVLGPAGSPALCDGLSTRSRRCTRPFKGEFSIGNHIEAMTRKYFKHCADSILGEGLIFLEATGDEITRQVEIYGDSIIWCDKEGQSDDRFMLADQPISIIGLGAEHEIPAPDFEVVWSRARKSQ